MTAKRFVDYFDKDHNYIIQDLQNGDEYQVGFVNCDEDVFLELINQLSNENEQLKTTIQQLRTDNTKQKKKLNTTMKENEQLKIALKDKENLINICEKKFKELGYLITCDDDGYVIE